MVYPPLAEFGLAAWRYAVQYWLVVGPAETERYAR